MHCGDAEDDIAVNRDNSGDDDYDYNNNGE